MPPILAMSHPEFTLVAGTITAIETDPAAIRFDIAETLRGSAKGSVRLLVDRAHLRRLSPGSKFLALYTDMVNAPLKPRKFLRDPDQARLMSFDGVPLTLFRDTPEWRALLTHPEPADWAASATYRAGLIDGLDHPDAGWRTLWAAEIALRAGHLAPFNDREQKAIQQFAMSPLQSPEARANLIQVAAANRGIFGQDWLEPTVAAVLETLASSADSTMSPAQQQLALVALRIAHEKPGHVSAETLFVWLQSSPILAETAALALRALDPKLERQGLERSLALTLLDTETRHHLELHQKRLAQTTASDMKH
ncbi:MAG: hypothetical protein IPK97_01330 [Ahniella sp.]|nr:hypothetical protein [Ahniella sp.]